MYEQATSGLGGPGALAAAVKPQYIIFIFTAIAALLCVLSSSSGNFPMSSLSGLSASAGLGLGFATTGATSSRLGAAGDNGDQEGAGTKGPIPQGPLQYMMLSVQSKLGMAALPPPVETGSSSSSSDEQPARGSKQRPPPDRPLPPRITVDDSPPSRTVGYGDNQGGDQLTDAGTPIYGSQTGQVGYGGTDTDQSGHRHHHLRNLFKHREGGERKHHLRNLFKHHDDQAAG